MNLKTQREAYLEKGRLRVEAVGGSGVVTSPEPDQEPRDCEMAARFERKTNGKRVELQRN